MKYVFKGSFKKLLVLYDAKNEAFPQDGSELYLGKKIIEKAKINYALNHFLSNGFMIA